MSSGEHFEADRLPGRRLALIALVVAVLAIAAVAWSIAIDGAGAPQLGPSPRPAAAQAIEHGPLWVDGSAANLAAQRAALHRFAWVDRAHGVVAIPIEDAIDLSLRRQP